MMKDLSSMTQPQFLEFLDSFDTILADCDGVLWHPHPIPGVKETLERLKNMGKNIYFVSNNGTSTQKALREKFRGIGLDYNSDHLVSPTKTIVKYLNGINFKGKKLYAIATPPMVQNLEDAGFEVIVGPSSYESTPENFRKYTSDDPEVHGVYIDMDLQYNYFKLTKAIALLKRPEVAYIVGLTDRKIKYSDGVSVPGPGYFCDIVSDISGRQPVAIGKPSEYLKKVVIESFQIKDPKRVLFIGDMIQQDMAFASLCGFQKLLVLSGGSTLKDAKETTVPEYKPDYWIQSLGHMLSVSDKINAWC